MNGAHEYVRQLPLLDAEGSLGTEEAEAESVREIDADGDGEVDVEEGAGQTLGSVFAVSGAKLLYLGHYAGSLYLNERVRPGLPLPEQWSEFKALAPLVKLHWHPYISSCAPPSPPLSNVYVDALLTMDYSAIHSTVL